MDESCEATEQHPRTSRFSSPQWISVDDYLPLQDLAIEDKPHVFGRYLVCVAMDSPDKDGSSEVTILEFHGKDGRWWSEGVPYQWGWHVTHWAELPEPPK